MASISVTGDVAVAIPDPARVAIAGTCRCDDSINIQWQRQLLITDSYVAINKTYTNDFINKTNMISYLSLPLHYWSILV